MHRLQEDGLIRAIGVSNFSVRQIQDAQLNCACKIVATQSHYNVQYREMEHKGVLQHCQLHDMMLIAYRPLQKGMLKGMQSEVMQALCQKYGKTPGQIAINWLISQKNVVTLSTMRSKEHLEENLGALGWEMETSDIELIRDQFPDQHRISDVYQLAD